MVDRDQMAVRFQNTRNRGQAMMRSGIIVGTDIGINEVNFHRFPSIIISRILSPALPFPKGFPQVFSLLSMVLVQLIILSGAAPASMLALTSMVSGLSVLSRSVTQGTERMQDSS